MNVTPPPARRTDVPPSPASSRPGAVSQSRVSAMIRFLEANRDRIERINKGQLTLHFGGSSVVPELVEKFETLN